MPAVKKYTRINFQNYPSTSTPLNATNLNKMDKGIDDLDDEVVAVKNTIENMSFDADSISYNNTSSGLQATDVQGAVDEINDNLSGFKFYPIGTNLVALVADDSFYKDANDKYVLADSPTGQTLLADTATYKALASTEETHGEVGADTCSPFSKQEDMIVEHMFGSPAQPFPTYTLLRDSKKLVIVVANYGGTAYCRLKLNGDSIPNTYENSQSGEYRQSGFIVENVKKNDVITLDINGRAGVTIVY